jgi:hypothetical protein
MLLRNAGAYLAGYVIYRSRLEYESLPLSILHIALDLFPVISSPVIIKINAGVLKDMQQSLQLTFRKFLSVHMKTLSGEST